MTKDNKEMKAAEMEFKRCLKAANYSYSEKVEHQLSNNNVRNVWHSVRNITGTKPGPA